MKNKNFRPAKSEAEAVGLKERSPHGLVFSSESFALSARRLQPRAAFILLAILLLILAGCRRAGPDSSDVEVEVTVNPNPPAVGQATVTLTFSDAGGQPVSGAQVELEGNMVHAGMAPTFSKPAEVAPGRYEAPLEFNMAGDWFILVKATLPDGRKLERQVDVPGVK
ncbi:MAG: FixH family protein [Anaerolineae bacterium]|nr:FixH family protein [Anaerolineae bacterium]